MQCVQCNRALPEGAVHCPYCGADLTNLPPTQTETVTGTGQVFCVKCGATLAPQASFCTRCSAPRPGVEYQPPSPYPVNTPMPPVQAIAGTLTCPRCGSTNVIKGKIAQWAIIAAIVGFFVICALSLLFLLVKEPNRCLNCAWEFK